MTWLIAIAIALFSLLALAQAQRNREIRRLRTDVQTATLLDSDKEISVFDVFWDLGANEFALEIMGHQDLLPERADDVSAVLETLKDRIREEGSYAAFVHVTSETIEEFERAHRAAGNRRLLPTPQVRERRLLSLTPESTEEHEGQTDASRRTHPIDEQRTVPSHRSVLTHSNTAAIDIDEVGKLGPASILRGLLHGQLSSELTTWWGLRKARALRKDLDRALVELADLLLGAEGQLIDLPHLFDVSNRWREDRGRIERLLEDKRFENRAWRNTAKTLLQTAKELAEDLTLSSQQDGERLIAALRHHLERGEREMAGYLAYLNRYAVFAGRGDDYVALSARIDAHIYRLQEELRTAQRTLNHGK
jgi:hypothetical protein